jgi:hypothetical protein
MDDPEHGPKQTDERRGAADRRQHRETFIRRAAFFADALREYALAEILVVRALLSLPVQALRVMRECTEERGGDLRLGALRLGVLTYAGSRIQIDRLSKRSVEAPICAAGAHGLQGLEHNEGPTRDGERQQNP